MEDAGNNKNPEGAINPDTRLQIPQRGQESSETIWEELEGMEHGGTSKNLNAGRSG